MATIWIRGDLIKAKKPKTRKKKEDVQPVELVDAPETESTQAEEISHAS